MKASNAEIQNDYTIALFVAFLSLAGTFMVLQSCIIGIKFSQGEFEPQNIRKQSYLKVTFNTIMLTFLGAIFIIPLEILENVCKIAKLPAILLGGLKGVKLCDSCFFYLKNKITGLNEYQLASLEQQRKVTSLLFENFPFTTLLVSIKAGVLNCPELVGGKSSAVVNISLGSTVLQILLTLFVTSTQSKSLLESTLSYFMTKMTANNTWIPYMHLITRRKCEMNINYGSLSVRMPFLTHVLGYYGKIEFEFNETTLNYLQNELQMWSAELNHKDQEQKYYITLQ